jgi:hypothetical protein
MTSRSRSVVSETHRAQTACLYTCEWTVTPQAKDILDSRFAAALEREGLVSFDLSHIYCILRFNFGYSQRKIADEVFPTERTA